MSMKGRGLEEERGGARGGGGLLEKWFWDSLFKVGMLIVPGAGLCPLAGGGGRSLQYFYLHVSVRERK